MAGLAVLRFFSMLRFRLFGIPFEVAPYFWIVSALFSGNIIHGRNSLLLLAVWVACVFVSIVVHELGHALTARNFGVDPKVEMYAMGGLTRMNGARFTRGQDFLVILAGPAAGFALYMAVRGTVYYLVTSVPAADDFLAGDAPTAIAAANALAYLSFINWTWTLFNLLPVLPLDGGAAPAQLARVRTGNGGADHRSGVRGGLRGMDVFRGPGLRGVFPRAARVPELPGRADAARRA